MNIQHKLDGYVIHKLSGDYSWLVQVWTDDDEPTEYSFPTAKDVIAYITRELEAEEEVP